MRICLAFLGLTLAAVRVAHASDPAIHSFDGTGRLVFQTVPAAASYRVEWTTNLVSPVWSSNPPGIGAIPASGGSMLTITVGVVHASCYYRAVAEVTDVPPVGLTNTFDLTSENWVVVDYPYYSHIPNPETSPLAFDGAFGAPAGSVRVSDVYYETGIAAPAEYLGNKLAYYGGTFAYDIYIQYTDGVAYPAVVLNGGTVSLYYDAPSPALNQWERRMVPLSETGWKVNGTGANATESVFRAVLANLTGLYICTEWHVGGDDTSVDNISISHP